LVLFVAGYNSTDAFNDRRLVDIARLIPLGHRWIENDSLGRPSAQNESLVRPSVENLSQDECSLPLLNTAVCQLETPTTAGSSAAVDGVTPADDESMLTDLKLGVSVPVSIVAGLPLTSAMTEDEPVVPKIETHTDELHYDPPPGVNPEAVLALERLLGMYLVRQINRMRYCRGTQRTLGDHSVFGCGFGGG